MRCVETAARIRREFFVADFNFHHNSSHESLHQLLNDVASSRRLSLPFKTPGSGIMNENQPESSIDLAEMTTEIVAAYVSHNSISVTDLPKLIADTHAALRNLSAALESTPIEKPAPAVPVKKSVTPDYLICLEDGKKFKSLKRHLRTHYDLSPEEYREKWGLPADYPMVAPSYSATRSLLAKANGLGRKIEAVEEPAKAARKKIGLRLKGSL